MLSILELRHIIESAFLPLECKCEMEGDGCLSIVVMDKGKVLSQVRTINPTVLKDTKAINQLIASIKAEINSGETSTNVP